jgi:hypothetical protein
VALVKDIKVNVPVKQGDLLQDLGPQAELEHFRKLAGLWVGKVKEEDTLDVRKEHDVQVEYKVTSDGTAIIETINPGCPHEMVTVIHADGKELVLTRYCGTGNQPRMKALSTKDEGKIVFEFVGATNMKSETELHTHRVMYTFGRHDQLFAEWTNYRDSKTVSTASFQLTRSVHPVSAPVNPSAPPPPARHTRPSDP